MLRKVSLNAKASMPLVTSLESTRKEKKSVRFKDTLEDIRIFIKTDRPTACQSNPSPFIYYTYHLRRTNWPHHGHPGRPIALDSIKLSRSDQSHFLIGHCQVVNIAYEKLVKVRYTLDNWQTYQEVHAAYKESILDSKDRFMFRIDLDVNTVRHISLALQYLVNGKEYWDNNRCRDYRLDIISKAYIGKSIGCNSDSGSSSSDDEPADTDDLIITSPLQLEHYPLKTTIIKSTCIIHL
ncbi:hypothetical protein G6F70_000354 [Rhizopus microsporus]|uniref:CBM21 domain-containing protein n=2 Tax=Rhizopus TaxID=4842 RepID=A0A367IX80_RHIAZ|nr:hypothetical protein G6F71_004131 [Rhizopus microsporus]RCH82288.1 hypothetical protein CU097_001988 [Rhizopus azygosporus]KAG1204616.1 hypothetical protein G6F70_000354 [Rhizopus microsporus]KAG1212020.1 hypothetical protein G6F69_004082 [Rhizopus microsporus]KAG1235080.1 hypothetical protein G6F67_003044 [Rhizopus microsporus]